LTRLRAAIVVTGTELVRGDRTDRNGPFLAQELHRLGIEPVRVTIVGDGPDELDAALREGLSADLCVVSGGLGPTHDDRTVGALARAAGVALEVDESLAREIEQVSRTTAERLSRPYEEFEPGVRKQASLPAGAISVGLAGTAPGIVLDTGSCVVVLLPGPPSELRRLWRSARESEPVGRLLAVAEPPARRVLRFFGVSESAVAGALEDAGGERSGEGVTVCARDYEVHVDMVGPGGEVLADGLRERLGEFLFVEDERSIAEIVLDLCRERGFRLGVAESCTGGLVAQLLTRVPGASEVFAGSVVAYANAAKSALLGVPEELLERHGAVSAEVAAAMAQGAREALRVDVAVSDTGIAGPGGGTAEKPVGLVYLHAADPDGELAQDFVARGGREDVRRRAAIFALHLVRRLLTQSPHSPA
jgi:competence/damage-inducible protein CinA-like protein